MTKSSNPWRTEFVVQPFTTERRGLRALPVQPASDKERALRLGERLSASNVGVVVFSRRIAPEIDEYDAPIVLARYGRVPAEVDDLLRA